MIDLRIYLPDIYDDVLEMQALMDTENYAFNELVEIVKDVQSDQYILTATERGILELEKMLGIGAFPDDSIEFRKERLINRLAKNQVYTLKALKQRLDNVLVVGSYVITVHHIPHSYSFHVAFSIGEYGKIQEVRNTIVELIPANMRLFFYNGLTTENSAPIRTASVLTIGMVYNLI